MKNKIPISMLVGLLFLVAITAFNISYVLIWNTFNNRLTSLNAREAAFLKLSEIAAYVDEFYINEYDAEDLLNGAADGYVTALPDESSHYLSSEARQRQEMADELGFTGIGIIGCQSRTYGGITVLDMYEGSTAEEFGIQRLDVITDVNGTSVTKLSYEGAMEAMRGEEGTDVTLTVYRPRTDETLTMDVRRGAVIPDRLFESRMLEDGIGYILVDNFDNGTDTLFLEALTTLEDQGMERLIIDLRFNPGGYMDVMTNMIDPLLEDGTVYSARHSGGELTQVSATEGSLGIPTVLLVNEYTVSAGEYFAAALQYHGAARVVGTETAGFGLAQSLVDLSDGSAMILSTLEYYTPAGESLQEVGVTPDHKVLMSQEQLYALLETKNGEDLQLNAALEMIRSMPQ
ncbi:MAG: S41 family peptidase [Ruminococcaceae bacterium]|nr:S41 family peptidase [Oscillospiraceae bacterium]